MNIPEGSFLNGEAIKKREPLESVLWPVQLEYLQ